eukprot:3188730-Pleurochrysis_carterae.AAC.1
MHAHADVVRARTTRVRPVPPDSQRAHAGTRAVSGAHADAHASPPTLCIAADARAAACAHSRAARRGQAERVVLGSHNPLHHDHQLGWC